MSRPGRARAAKGVGMVQSTSPRVNGGTARWLVFAVAAGEHRDGAVNPACRALQEQQRVAGIVEVGRVDLAPLPGCPARFRATDSKCWRFVAIPGVTEVRFARGQVRPDNSKQDDARRALKGHAVGSAGA